MPRANSEVRTYTSLRDVCAPAAGGGGSKSESRSKAALAIYRLSASVISRSKGRSATAAAAYRAGCVVVDERTGEVHDYERRRGVDDAFIVAPDSAPEWSLDRSALWNAVEAAEKRKDAQVCREIQLALPCELNAAERRALVEDWVRQELVERGMIADVALHSPDAGGDQRNSHAHVLLTMRSIGPSGFGSKVREWNSTELLERWRESWADACNRALERAGSGARVDHRSLAAQLEEAVRQGDQVRAAELYRAPQVHMGPVVTRHIRQALRDKSMLMLERATAFVDRLRDNALGRTIAAQASELWWRLRRARLGLGVDEPEPEPSPAPSFRGPGM